VANTELILDPLKEYNTMFKTDFNDAAEEYFEKLSDQAKVDEEENASLVKKYNEKKVISDGLGNKLNGLKGIRTALIIFSILFIVVGLFLLFLSEPEMWKIIVSILLFALAITGIILIPTILNKKIKARDEAYKKALEETNVALRACWDNMAPLNNMFRYNMGADISKMIQEAFEVDQIFDLKKYELLHSKYGMKDFVDIDTSVYDVLSGTLGNSPFLLAKTYNTALFDKTYTGSTTYTWTTRDSKGRVSVHTDTLYAEVVRPAPRYWYYTTMYYGNEFAPKLHFTRYSKDVDAMNEKQTEKYVAKKAKELRKKEIKSTRNGGNFTLMGDEKFEALFEATNRTDEVEFRMLFTPLARKNMVSLLMDDDNYGDDFHFIKEGMINKISSTHSNRFNYFAKPEDFYDYDYKRCKQKFLNYENEYFKGIYFDLAPVMAIPDYQEYEPDEYIFKGVLQKLRNVTPEETESLINELDYKLFVNSDCSTSAILKTKLIKKDDDIDEIEVNAYYYEAIPRSQTFTKMGRDGRMHTIVVKYIDYEPRTKVTPFAVMNFNTDEKSFREKLSSNETAGNFIKNFVSNAVVRNGLFGFIPSSKAYEGKSEEIKNYFENKKGE
jgi:hypothetical protein